MLLVQRVLESWDQVRDVLDWDRARHGLGPMSVEHLNWMRSALGEPPRVSYKEWVCFINDLSEVRRES